MKRNVRFLEELVSRRSPSGLEKECVEQVFNTYCSKFAEKFYSDKIGNSVFSIGTGKKTILLSGHIDELGMQVIKIESNGMLVVYPLSIDKKVLPGSKVEVQLKNGNWITGIIGKKPIHAETSDDRSSVNKISELTIDLGFTTADEVKEAGVKIGSFVVYERNYDDINFGNSQVLAPGLDDKAGVYISAMIGQCLSEYPEVLKKYKILIAATTQEEVGLRGATVLAQNIKPDISIDFDVTPSNDFGVKSEEWGEVKVGDGPVIEYGPDKSIRICEEIEKIAEQEKIKIQPVVTGRPGGTNTDVLQLFGGDCETAHIALPIKNLHTAVEICNWDDIDNTIKLVCELIISGKL